MENGSSVHELLSIKHNPCREISLTGYDPTSPKAVLQYEFDFSFILSYCLYDLSVKHLILFWYSFSK